MKSSISKKQIQLNLNNHKIREFNREAKTRSIYHSTVIPREIDRLKEKIQIIDSQINKIDPEKVIPASKKKYEEIYKKIIELKFDDDKKGLEPLFEILEVNDTSIKLLESNQEKVLIYIDKEKKKEIPLIEVDSYKKIADYLTNKLTLYREANKLKKEIQKEIQIDSVFVLRYNEITKNKSDTPQGIQKQIEKVSKIIRSITKKFAKSPKNVKVIDKALKDYQLIYEHLLNKKELAIQKIRKSEESYKMLLANDKRKKCESLSKKIKTLVPTIMKKLNLFKTTLDDLLERSEDLKKRKIDEKYAAELGMSLSQFKVKKKELKTILEKDIKFKGTVIRFLSNFPGLIKSKTPKSPSIDDLLTAMLDYSTKKA